jgi:hypothetical protein
MARIKDMLAHDPKFANMINQRWNQKFQYESFIPAFKYLVSEDNAQLVDISNKLDQFGVQLSQFINIEIDKFAKQSSAVQTPVAPTQTTSAIDAASQQTSNPVAPAQVTPNTASQQTLNPVVSQDDAELKTAARTVQEKPLDNSNGPAYMSMTREQVIDNASSLPRKKKLESNAFSARDIKKNVGNVDHVDEDGKIESTGGRRDILSLAKMLGYKTAEGNSLPRSVASVPVDEWNTIADYVIAGLRHLGFIGETKNQPIKASNSDIGVATTPIEKPIGTPVQASNNDIGATTTPTPVENPPTETDWRQHEKSVYHKAHSNRASQHIFKELRKYVTNPDDVYQAMNYYWDKNGLENWNPENKDKDIQALKDILGVKPEEGKPEIKPEEGKPEIKPEEGKPEIKPEEGKPEIKPEEGKPEIKPEEGKPEEGKPEEGTPEEGTPEELKQPMFSMLQQHLRDDYLPEFDGEHVQNFLNHVNVAPYMKKEDQEAALKQVVDLFAKFQGVEVSKKQKLEKKKKQPELEPTKSESKPSWKDVLASEKLDDDNYDDDYKPKDEDDYENQEDDEDDDEMTRYFNSSDEDDDADVEYNHRRRSRDDDDEDDYENDRRRSVYR